MTDDEPEMERFYRDDRIGTEWQFALESLARQINGLLLIEDRDLYSQSDSDREIEKAGIRRLRRDVAKTIAGMIDQIDQLPLDEVARWHLAESINRLVGIGIQAGPYSPWIDRLRALKSTDHRKRLLTDQAALATQGLRQKLEPRDEIIRRHLKAAPRKADGTLCNPGMHLKAINRELAESDQMSPKTFQRRRKALKKGQL